MNNYESVDQYIRLLDKFTNSELVTQGEKTALKSIVNSLSQAVKKVRDTSDVIEYSDMSEANAKRVAQMMLSQVEFAKSIIIDTQIVEDILSKMSEERFFGNTIHTEKYLDMYVETASLESEGLTNYRLMRFLLDKNKVADKRLYNGGISCPLEHAEVSKP